MILTNFETEQVQAGQSVQSQATYELDRPKIPFRDRRINLLALKDCMKTINTSQIHFVGSLAKDAGLAQNYCQSHSIPMPTYVPILNCRSENQNVETKPTHNQSTQNDESYPFIPVVQYPLQHQKPNRLLSFSSESLNRTYSRVIQKTTFNRKTYKNISISNSHKLQGSKIKQISNFSCPYTHFVKAKALSVSRKIHKPHFTTTKSTQQQRDQQRVPRIKTEETSNLGAMKQGVIELQKGCIITTEGLPYCASGGVNSRSVSQPRLRRPLSSSSLKSKGNQQGEQPKIGAVKQASFRSISASIKRIILSQNYAIPRSQGSRSPEQQFSSEVSIKHINNLEFTAQKKDQQGVTVKTLAGNSKAKQANNSGQRFQHRLRL